MRRILPIGMVVLVVALFVGGRVARGEMDVDFSADALRAYVLAMGVAAPITFVLLVVFRNFLLLPSMVVLSAGGLVFGAGIGTLLGGAGILVSALMKFSIARGVGSEWVRPKLGPRFRELEQRVQSAGPMLVGLCTAHPMGPMSGAHWAAGFSSVAFLPFLGVVLFAGPIRAFAYSLFGASLIDPGSREFYIATGLLVAIAVLPLAHPGVRRRLVSGLRGGRSAGSSPLSPS